MTGPALRSSRLLAPAPIALACGGACVLALIAVQACGGSTGREGLTLPGQQVASGDDATVSDFDAGLFDVVILYADRVVPEVGPKPEAGEAGSPYPNCPPFIPILGGTSQWCSGGPVMVVDPAISCDELPSDWAADGSVVFADSASACATYGWLGSPSADECTTSNCLGTNQSDFIDLPPCNWVADAGLAAAGPRVGDPRYRICMDLYACIQNSGCIVGSRPIGDAGARQANDLLYCLCGNDGKNCDASGPCGYEELSALEQDNPELAPKFLIDTKPTDNSFGGGVLGQVYQCASASHCLQIPDAGDASSQ